MTNEIKKILKLRNMTQVELAEKLGISAVNLSQRLSKDNYCEFKAFFILHDED